MDSLPLQIAEGILLGFGVIVLVAGSIALIVWRFLNWLGNVGKPKKSN